jgi:hypothetical protein
MKFINNLKKGELSTQQIVLLIILILSFIIILFFLFRMNFGGESEKDICRNSVMMRGTSSVSSDALPLKCSRNYICITQNGDCIGMVKPTKIKVKTEEEVYEALAKEMSDCWWMLGDGKVDYIGKDFFFKDNYCSICDQILFDSSLTKIKGFEKGKISKDKLYDYMAKTKMPTQNITYAEYLLGTNEIATLKQEIAKNQSAQVSFGTISIGQPYYLITGITSEVNGRGWKIAAAVGISVVGWWFPGTWATWAGLIGGAVIVGVGEYGAGKEVEIGAITVKGRGISNEFMSPTIQEANSETFDKLNCYEVVSAS